MNEETDAMLNARRSAWRAIQEAMSLDVHDRVKLERCLSISNVHCAMTGDESLVPPVIRESRGAAIAGLEVAIHRATKAKKDAEIGQSKLL